MATAILADANIQGHVVSLVASIQAGVWRELWESLGVRVLTFGELGLEPAAPDRQVWRSCQANGAVLVTANRNADDPDSLEATIREEAAPTSLPVLTISTANRLLTSREYADWVAVKLLEYLLDLDTYRGTGRLFLP